MQCYAVRDEKAGCFFTPGFAKNQHDAVRSITQEVNNPQSNLCLFADDFSLYLLGVVDINTGELTKHINGPERITHLSILKQQPKTSHSNKA